MIEDVKYMELFPVNFTRVVLDIDHDKILDYTLNFVNNIDSYTTYHDSEINQEWRKGLDELDRLEEDIVESAKRMCKHTDRRLTDPILITMWASVYNNKKGHGSHIHRRSLISGTYYPVGNEDHSSIQFESPYYNYCMHDTIDEKHLNKSFKPTKGDMLMWPSWLNHRVWQQQPTEHPRVAISFNVDSKRA